MLFALFAVRDMSAPSSTSTGSVIAGCSGRLPGHGGLFRADRLHPRLTHVIVPFLLIYGSATSSPSSAQRDHLLIPTEVFGSGADDGHGIAAGVGKLGAFLGVFLFPVLSSTLAWVEC